ncbi:MAG: nucleotidyltransferase domain-containing protein [Anaerolineae bacterium]
MLELARKYQDDGLTLLVFGSFARGDQRPTSDLDLGVEWHGKRRPEIFLRLYWDVQELPTIRKIELVDFEQTDSDFRRVAGLDKIYLVERRGAQ